MTVKKKVLVTGGAGCIGLEVYKQLLKAGYHPIVYDLIEKIQKVSRFVKIKEFFYGSILDRALLSKAMQDVDYVVHLAAHLGVQRTEEEPLRCLEININGSKNVFETALQSNVKRVIFASSSEVYGEPLDKYVSEKSITQGKSVYAISKLAGEEYLKALCKENKKFTGIVIRFFNTFGPYQTAQFVIPKFINLVKRNSSPIINGTGEQVRSYCYVSDSATGTVNALKKVRFKENFSIFNIGNPYNSISVLNLAKRIIEMSKTNIKPKINSEFSKTDRIKEREVYARLCDITKAKSELKFNPRVNLISGLDKTYNSEILWEDWPKHNKV